MERGYTVRLVARNEGVEYRDQFDVYRFDVTLAGKKWTVVLPGSQGEQYATHELSDDERATILPRISKYLEGRKQGCAGADLDPKLFTGPRLLAAAGRLIGRLQFASDFLVARVLPEAVEAVHQIGLITQ
jgi:hypothetical protein